MRGHTDVRMESETSTQTPLRGTRIRNASEQGIRDRDEYALRIKVRARRRLREESEVGDDRRLAVREEATFEEISE